MPAPIFMTLGSLALKGVQGAGKSIVAGWKAGKVGAGNQIAGNTTSIASYGSTTIEPKLNEDPGNKNNMLYFVILGVAVVAFFLIKKK